MQSYTEIPSSQTLQSSLSLLLNNYKSIMSCFSGTAWPTTNLQVGMLCYRTDQKKLTQLTAIIEGVPTWTVVADLSTDVTEQMSAKLDTTGGTITGRVTVSNTTASTSKTTGALVVSGGMGVDGTIYASGFNGALTGNATSATKLATARTIALSGAATGTATQFDGSTGITIPVTSLNAFNLTGIVAAARLEGTYNISISGTAEYAGNSGTVAGLSPGRGAGQYIATVSSGGGVMEVGRYIDFHGSDTSSEDYTVRLDGGAVGSTTLTCQGNFVASGNVAAYSDRRVKRDIRPIKGAMERVKKIAGVTFARIDLPKKRRDERFMGVIAQDVIKVAPHAVKRLTNGRLAVDYMGLTGLLIEAIKDLDMRIDNIERNYQ